MHAHDQCRDTARNGEFADNRATRSPEYPIQSQTIFTEMTTLVRKQPASNLGKEPHKLTQADKCSGSIGHCRPMSKMVLDSDFSSGNFPRHGKVDNGGCHAIVKESFNEHGSSNRRYRMIIEYS